MRKRFLAVSFFAVFGLASLSFADTMAWQITEVKTFGTVNLNTGKFNKVSDLPFIAAGLGQVAGTLYVPVFGGTDLYRLSASNGALTPVGQSVISYFGFGSTNSALYMVDTVGTLWTINAADGTATIVGSTRLDLTGVKSIALSAGSNALYLAINSDLFVIDTTSGLASYVGTSGATDFGAIVDIRGTIYANSITGPNAVYTYDPATSVVSTVQSNSGSYAWGLAAVVPEPGSFVLIGLGVLLGGYSLRRRRS
ncbi:MAG TPA: PEP-CTERM sorting domain-containing protein [Bryobacteraceae bacterium]|jgi:hypothetical protein